MGEMPIFNFPQHARLFYCSGKNVSMPELLLPVTGAFHFALTARVLARLPEHNKLECWDETTGLHRRALRTERGPMMVTAQAVGQSSIRLSDNSPSSQAWAHHSFGLGFPPEEFYAVAKKDPVLKEAIKKLRGLRPPMFDPWEAWVATVLGQQITLSFCLQQIAAVSKKIAGAIDGYPLHPTPTEILAANPEDLLACKVSGRKTEYLKTLAEATLNGYFKDVPSMPLQDALAHLVALRGVGMWTARFYLATTGRMDSLAYGDAGLASAYKMAYGHTHDLEAWGEGLGNVRGWAYWYLIWFIKYQP